MSRPLLTLRHHLLMSSILLGICISQPSLANQESQELHKEAQKFIERNDPNTAIIQLKNAISKDENDFDARLTLADLYYKMGQFPSAEKEYEILSQKGMDDKKFVVSLADCYMRSGKYEELLSKIQPKQRGKEIESRILGARGFAMIAKGEQQEGKVLIQKAILENKQNPEIQLWQFNLDLLDKDQVKAEQTIDTILKDHPDFTPAQYIKAELLKSAQKSQEAQKIYEKILEKNPQDLQAAFNIFNLHVSKNENDSAQKDLDIMRKISPEHPYVVYAEALMLSKDNKTEEALAKLASVDQFAHQYPPALYLLGALNYQADHIEQAEANLKSLLGIAPGSLQARFLLADLYFKKNQNDKALSLLEDLDDSKINDSSILNMIASGYIKAGKPERGIEILERVASLNPDDQISQTRLAVAQLQGGKLDAGIDELENIVKKNPDSTDNSILLVIGLIQNNQLDEARKLALQLKEKLNDSPIPNNFLGSISFKENDLVQAESAFKQAVAIKKDFTPAHVNLGQLYIAQKKYADAQKEYESILAYDDKNIQAYMGLGQLSMIQQDINAAEGHLKKAIEKNPDNINLALKLVDFYISNSQFDQALSFAKSVISKNPDNINVLDALGRAQIGTKQYESVIQTYSQINSIRPGLPMAHYRIAQALFAKKDERGAKVSLENALQADSKFFPAYKDLIALAIKNNDYDEAFRIAQQLKQKNAANFIGDMVIGDLYFQKGDYLNAEQSYIQAAALQMNLDIAMRQYQVNMKLNRPENALKILQEISVKSPNDPQIKLLIAEHFLKVRDYAQAKDQYSKLSEQVKDNPYVLNNLAWASFQMKDERALDISRKAHELAPHIPEIADTYGWILTQKGEYAQAVKILKDASEKSKNPEVLYHYAFALIKSGDKEQGKKILKQLIDSKAPLENFSEAQKLLEE